MDSYDSWIRVCTTAFRVSAPLHLDNAFLSLKLLSRSLSKIEKDSDDILKDAEIFVYNYCYKIVTYQEKIVG